MEVRWQGYFFWTKKNRPLGQFILFVIRLFRWINPLGANGDDGTYSASLAKIPTYFSKCHRMRSG